MPLAAPEPKPRTPLPRTLCIFWAGSLAAFGLMFLIAWLRARTGIIQAYWDPLGDPLYFDLFENMPTFALLHTGAFWVNANPLTPTVAYPPFAVVLMQMLYASGYPASLYMLLAGSALLPAGWCARRALVQAGLAPWTATLFLLTTAICSFPLVGLLQKGNIELLLWIFAAAGIWAFHREHPYAAAILWALAAAVKLYPIVFLVLFLPRRQYRPALLGAISFVAVSIASMLYLGPTLQAVWFGSLHNVFGYQGKRIGEWTMRELAENHSFFTAVKTVVVIAGHSPARLTLPYYACGGLAFALLFFGRLQKMPFTNQLLGVSVFMVLLPPVSYFHTLVHLYAPWLLLVLLSVRAARAGVHIPGLNTTILLCLPLFACFTLLTFPSILLFGGILQAACLTALMICAASFAFAERPPAWTADRLPRGARPI